LNAIEQLLARAQVGLAFLFAIGFFALLFILLTYHREMTSTELTILTGLVSVLGTLLALIMNFFFARTRPTALPDPTTTTTTTTTTPTPVVVPVGSALATAPSPPIAIIPAIEEPVSPLPPTTGASP
jgi:hypothetical protein